MTKCGGGRFTGMLRSPSLHLLPVENLFLVRSRGHDGFGVRDTLEHHGLACTPQALRRETPEILAAPCCFWRGRLNLRGEA